MNTPAIDVVHNPAATRFEVRLGTQVAVLEYRRQGTAMYYTHVGVPPAYEAQGIAAALTKQVLEYARDHALTVHPICRYVAVYVRRHREYQSLLPHAPRPSI